MVGFDTEVIQPDKMLVEESIKSKVDPESEWVYVARKGSCKGKQTRMICNAHNHPTKQKGLSKGMESLFEKE